MKRAALALVLMLGLTAWVQHARQYEMIELSYVSQACEMMGRLQISWFEDWPPEGPRQEARGARVRTDIGPDSQCGIVVYMPTRSGADGEIAATIFGLTQNDTTVDQYRGVDN